MRIRRTLLFTALCMSSLAGNVGAYNILALDTGGYWNNLYDQYFGASQGFGVPGASDSRFYTMVSSEDLAGANLMDFDVFLVASGFTDDWVEEPATEALAALAAKSSDIFDFVQAGRGLVAWSEPFPDDAEWDWSWAPVDLGSEGVYHENAVEVIDPSHPAMRHSTDASLSDWGSSWHGYFESWDPRLDPLARTGDYGVDDPRTHRALTVAGSLDPLGSGRMLFSMQDPDYHAYQGFSGAQAFIRDALDWTAVSHPVPEPGPGVLVAAGLGAVALIAWVRSRRR